MTFVPRYDPLVLLLEAECAGLIAMSALMAFSVLVLLTG